MSSKDLLSLEQSNDSKSVYEAAKAYFSGKGVKRDYHKAFSLFKKTVELDPGFVTAYRFLGISYEKGLGTKADMEKALHYYSEGSRLDSPACNFYLARAYENGNGVPKSEAKALELYKSASEAGVADAMLKVGIFAYLGMGMEASRQKSIEWLLRARDAGNETGAELADLVMNSNLSSEELEFRFLRVLAESENAKAQNRLGVFYMTGNGVEIDEVEACNWFKRASELGYEYAMKNYAICLRDGAGCEANKSTAVEWFEKAARLGNIQSKYFLTEIYLEDGVLANEKRAVSLLEEVIDSGNAEYADSARIRLANYYDQTHEYTKAFALWEVAASHRNAAALYNLGFYYHNGLGTAVDDTKAMYCWKKAIENGSGEARQALLDLLKQREMEAEETSLKNEGEMEREENPDLEDETEAEDLSEVEAEDPESSDDFDTETGFEQSDEDSEEIEDSDETEESEEDESDEEYEDEQAGIWDRLKNSVKKKGKAGYILLGLMGGAILVIIIAVILLLTRMKGCQSLPAESSIEESSEEESSIEESSVEESSEESSIEESSEEESSMEESSEEEDPILGAYKGYYTTGQGRKGLTVTLYRDEETEELMAIFEFYPYEDSSAWVGPNYSGSYQMTVENEGDTYNCYALEWIDNPADLEMIHLLGTIQDGVYTGVNNYGRAFELTKVASQQNESSEET